jgi:hypothetical protein
VYIIRADHDKDEWFQLTFITFQPNGSIPETKIVRLNRSHVLSLVELMREAIKDADEKEEKVL